MWNATHFQIKHSWFLGGFEVGTRAGLEQCVELSRRISLANVSLLQNVGLKYLEQIIITRFGC